MLIIAYDLDSIVNDLLLFDEKKRKATSKVIIIFHDFFYHSLVSWVHCSTRFLDTKRNVKVINNQNNDKSNLFKLLLSIIFMMKSGKYDCRSLTLSLLNHSHLLRGQNDSTEKT